MNRIPMSFYHAEGIVPAWQNAMHYCNEGGQIATLPEIVQARVAAPKDSHVWQSYFTTRSAEYFGRDQNGELVIVVAHGVGPMSTLEGIKRAYSYSYKSTDRNRRGGRITREEFLKLCAGEYGPVFKVSYKEYIKRFEYPFIEPTKYSQIATDELAIARFSGTDLLNKYMKLVAEDNREMLIELLTKELKKKDQGIFVNAILRARIVNHYRVVSPIVLKNADCSNLPYLAYDKFHPDGEMAFAHLLAIGGHQQIQFWEEEYPSLLSEIACHDWNDGTRLLAIPHDASLKVVIDGPDPRELVFNHWKKLLVPVDTEYVSTMFTLMKMRDGSWFTEYRTRNQVMDSGDPQFMVTSIKPVGEVVTFSTPILGYHGFFKYETSHLKTFAPPKANAYYFVGEPTIVWKDGNPVSQTCDVQFYKITVDSKRQIITPQRLSHDYDLMLKLMGF